ncbi:hypothetical protein MSG28_009446 [Choristoneura fumiferana]|uniref:Uncharacterized protein n=1 Tax=Choristoneura fumiferana TaxID=7141 RepID=A0ACC0JBJ2_CHOFU|nr:hypothetical protein MSG28_009446 [Choristoneura fumiferana]
MGMSRCYSLMKCLLILLNIVFLCIGVSACGFAVWALWSGAAGAGGAEGAAARAALCALAAWGGALALGAAAALAGAARDAASLLAAAFALLALAGVAEAAAASWGAAHLPQLRRALAARLHAAVHHDYGPLPVPTQFIDAIQTDLECCGASGARDWQGSAWSRAQAAAEAGAEAGAGAGEGAAADALDLSISAPSAFYHVPPSCCVQAEAGVDPASGAAACAAARRVPAASSSAPGLHPAACAPRVLAALEEGARLPLALGAALLALHAAALLLALALCLRARPAPRYKA